MSTEHVFEQLTKPMLSLQQTHPLRVGIDGIDAAGKTTLADRLAQFLETEGRPVIRASIDGFHRPRAERYKRGKDSAEGYYEDAFDYISLRDVLLIPLGQNGNRQYKRAVFDFRTDMPLKTPEETAPHNALLLFDGVFLLRPEIVDWWDYRIFVKIDFETGLKRALQRDGELLGSVDVVKTRYLTRYYPGQRRYLHTARPEQCADVVIENSDFSHPKLFFHKRK